MSEDQVLSNNPDAETIDPYSSYRDWKSWDKSRFGVSNPEEQGYFQKLLALANPPEDQDVCEIGFGNGALLCYLVRCGYRVFGVEVQTELVARANEHGITAVADVAQFASDLRFDLILLVDVLEHIPQNEIPEFLASMKARLKPGGRVIARFPNGDSPFGLKNQNGDATHVSFIGSKKLDYFARRAGLLVIHLGAEPIPILSGSVTKMMKKALSIPLRYLLRKILTTFLTLPMDKSFFSQNLVAVLENRNTAPAD